MKKFLTSYILLLLILQVSFAQSEYSWVGEYVDGLALAQNNDRFGYIDPNGAVAIPLRFAAASEFRQGEAMIMVGSAHEYSILKIDTLGHILWSFEEGLRNNENRMKFIDLTNSEFQVMVASGLVIRDKPDLSGQRIAVVPYKGSVKVLKKTYSWITVDNIKSQWVEVEFNGLKGFCFMGFLTQMDVDKFNYFYRYQWINDYQQKSHWKLKKEKLEEMIFLEDSGVFVVSSGTPETCARGQAIYLPDISMQDAFLLIKAACIECSVVLETDKRGFSSKTTNISDYNYPADSHQTSISFLLDQGLGHITISIEEDNNGYVRIKM
ncbi:SH3 domain-containing protein [Perlabentimonas gracilis]|uniref:SH3 domain-containing protein n=1 Tax=Perlabentimonas gracilis TaxID=2715279 RepID=UPI00140E21F2|nr:SH3 domain-containing protein [Perlabentimonas gracilis]NHB69637.1 SH3 domain-containing protein [Perlabentimonas gracilis]